MSSHLQSSPCHVKGWSCHFTVKITSKILGKKLFENVLDGSSVLDWR